MAAGTGAVQRDVGGEFGARRRQVQRWISTCENGGQWQQALALLSEILDAKLKLDVITAMESARPRRASRGSGPRRCSAREKRRNWSQGHLRQRRDQHLREYEH